MQCLFKYSQSKYQVFKQKIYEKYVELYSDIHYQNIQFSNRKFKRQMQCFNRIFGTKILFFIWKI